MGYANAQPEVNGSPETLAYSCYFTTPSLEKVPLGQSYPTVLIAHRDTPTHGQTVTVT